jgi:hypothetical protein
LIVLSAAKRSKLLSKANATHEKPGSGPVFYCPLEMYLVPFGPGSARLARHSRAGGTILELMRVMVVEDQILFNYSPDSWS